jgi:hypothetical protein
MVTVDRDVSVEVLDWGGSGRPLVLLAGLGNTAHVFDDLAQRLTSLGRFPVPASPRHRSSGRALVSAIGHSRASPRAPWARM